MQNKIKLYSLLLFALIISCDEVQKEDSEDIIYTGKPKIEFTKTSHDFGNLTVGEIVECSFKYKNTGTAPLKIISVDADCGCTVPKYSKNELLPGDEERIKVIFNSAGFRNNILKTIDVETNTDNKYIELVLTAFIENKQL